MIRVTSKDTYTGNAYGETEVFSDLEALEADLKTSADPEYASKVLEGLAQGNSVDVYNSPLVLDTYTVIAEGRMTTTQDDLQATLVERRVTFAAAFKQASEQLDKATEQMNIARGVVQNKSLETALWGWRWARTVNELHGVATVGGSLSRPGILTNEQSLAYCKELGLSTALTARGRASGASTIRKLRRVASRVSSEEHLRELLSEYGSIWRIDDSLRESNARVSAQELRERDRDKNRQRMILTKRPAAAGYSRFIPPQSWISYLIQQGLLRSEISAALCLCLDALGPEEAYKIWDRAGRPRRYEEKGRQTGI